MKTCLQEKYGLFINGQWQPASDGKTFKSYNPANGELLAECAQATDADLDLAVDSAWKVSTLLCPRSPFFTSLHFKRVLLNLRLISAVFIFMESAKPSFEPLMTFSESIS